MLFPIVGPVAGVQLNDKAAVIVPLYAWVLTCGVALLSTTGRYGCRFRCRRRAMTAALLPDGFRVKPAGSDPGFTVQL